MLGYQDRDDIIKTMGFKNYEEYLDSDLWKRIRAKVFERDSHMCRLCDRPAKAVHHSGYSHKKLTGKTLKGMFSLCHGCHKRVEFSSVDGHKLAVNKVKKKTSYLLKCRDKEKAGKKVRKGKPHIGLAHRAKHIARKYGR